MIRVVPYRRAESNFMKASITFLLSIGVGVASAPHAAPIDRAAIIQREVVRGERTWAAALEPERNNLRSSELFSYALALCEAKAHAERLEKLFATAQMMQDLDAQNETFGSFRWNWSDAKVKDRNAIEFAMQPASIIWLKHRDALPAASKAKLLEIFGPAAKASVTHRVADGYTNIAVMSAGNLILLGEGLDRADLVAEGCARLQSLFNLTARAGIREYVSPDYYGIDLSALQLLDTFAQHPVARRQARALLELFWTDVAANFWWPVRRLSGAHSRNYDYLHGLGGLDSHLSAAGLLGDTSAAGLIPAIVTWQPSPELIAMSKTKLPRLVRQMWGSSSAIAETQTPGSPVRPAIATGGVWAGFTHWLAQDVTLSIAGANYGPIDIPLAVDFPGPRDSVRCIFMPDGRGDPYGKSKIPWRGHPKAVHLQPFFVGVQETQDALALVVYRDADVPVESTSLHSHFVMPRAVDAVFVGQRQVEFAEGKPKTVVLSGGEPVFLRKGTAAVAVRVPDARTRAGKPAPVALVWDANERGAIRLTVDHQHTSEPPRVEAAAVLQVRVGSELSDAAFAEFRRRFRAERTETSFESERVALTSPTLNRGQSLAIAAAAPWASPLRLEPSVPRVLLEIDGEDVGRKLLDAAR